MLIIYYAIIIFRPKERKKRLSSRRMSSIDKEPLQLVEPLVEFSKDNIVPEKANPIQTVLSQQAVVGPVVLSQDIIESSKPDSQPVVTKERTTRARSAATNVVAPPPPLEEPTPVVTPPVPATRRTRTESITSRQRNKSGQGEVKVVKEPLATQEQQHRAPFATPIVAPAATTTTPQKPTTAPKPKGEPLSREERKLQSVLRLIERLESNQKKKESRQTQRKDKGGSSRKGDDEDHEDLDSQTDHVVVPTPPVKTVKFVQQIHKRKGKKRGRSGSHSSKVGATPTAPMVAGKPQMISQRNSGSGGDQRSTSTESEINSADDTRETSSPTGGGDFRLPKTKRVNIYLDNNKFCKFYVLDNEKKHNFLGALVGLVQFSHKFRRTKSPPTVHAPNCQYIWLSTTQLLCHHSNKSFNHSHYQ